MLWIAKRVQPDVDPAISFLCTRVNSLTKEYWWKLKRMMQWVNHTINDKRVVGAMDLNELFTLVDTEYAAHNNRWSNVLWLGSPPLPLYPIKIKYEKFNRGQNHWGG